MTQGLSKELFQQIISALLPLYSEQECRQIAFILLEYCFNLKPEEVIMNKAILSSVSQFALLDEALKRLLAAEPIQYVTGQADFYGRKFLVDRSVLIPRQETEELVRAILNTPRALPPSVLDIGSGSGCIAVTLALEWPESRVTALEVDAAAMQITRKNSERLGALLNCIEGDIFHISEIGSKYDIIVSNPPYVTESEKALMHDNVLVYEPALALFVPDKDPLRFHRKILEQAKKWLNAGGDVFFEINERFGAEIEILARTNGFLENTLIKDLHGKNRIIRCRQS